MCWWLEMGVTGSRSAAPVRVVHAGGHVDEYRRRVTVDELMRSHPRHCVARPEVFQSPSSALLAPEVVLAPGDKLLLVPNRTVVKLYRKHGLPRPMIVPATPTRSRVRVEGLEKDAWSSAGAHCCCTSGRHGSECRSSSLQIAAAAASRGATRVEKSGSSRSRLSSRDGTSRRRSGLSQHGAARTPRGSPRAGRGSPRKGVRGGRTSTRGRKSPGTSAQKQPDRKALQKSKVPKLGDRASSIHSNVSAGSKPSREVLDVKSSACCKSNHTTKVFPVQDGSEQVPVPAPSLVVDKVSEIRPSSKAAPVASQVNSKIVKAATAIQSSGRKLPDAKSAPRTGHANRSLHKPLGEGRHGKPGDELGALVKRINSLAVLSARASSRDRKTGHPMPPTTVSVKAKVQMFEEASRAAAGQPISVLFQRPKKARTDIGASESRPSNQMLDSVKNTTPKSLGDSSAPSIHVKSGTMVPLQTSGPSPGVTEPTLASFGGGSSSPALLIAFEPSSQLAYMQKELSQAPQTVDLAQAYKDGSTTGNGESLSGKTPLRRRVQGRVTRTLRELIEHADLLDKQQGYVTPAEGLVSCITDSQPMQEDNLPVGRTASASESDLMVSPDSDDSFIELVIEENGAVTAVPTPDARGRKPDEVENYEHSEVEKKLPVFGERSAVTVLVPGSVSLDNISGQVGCKRFRRELRDHLQMPSPPTNVGCPSTTSGLRMMFATPDATSCTGSNCTISDPDESPLFREFETHEHPSRMSAGDKGARRKHLPKPNRLPVGGRRRYKYRWRPKLSPLFEGATEGCTEVHTMS